MDKEVGTRVKLNILLNSYLLGFIGVTSAESSVKHSEDCSHSEPHEELNDWPVNVKKHSSNKSVTNIIEPPSVEVCQLTAED